MEQVLTQLLFGDDDDEQVLVALATDGDSLLTDSESVLTIQDVETTGDLTADESGSSSNDSANDIYVECSSSDLFSSEEKRKISSSRANEELERRFPKVNLTNLKKLGKNLVKLKFIHNSNLMRAYNLARLV